MGAITHMGIDLAKNFFHIFGADALGNKVLSKKLHRKHLKAFMAQQQPCEVAMESCASAHYWSRCFQTMGHTVKLIHPGHVKPYRQGNKNDANDAAAIYEASTRPHVRDVPTKTVEQQDLVALHRMREMVICQRTQLINQIRGLLLERGVAPAKGHRALRECLVTVMAEETEDVTSFFRTLLQDAVVRLSALEEEKAKYDKYIKNIGQRHDICRRLQTIPGIGPICATALYAAIGRGHDFKNGRELAAWLGLVPKQNTTGGKPKMLGISKRGDRYLRKQLVHGARSLICRPKSLSQRRQRWLEKLKQRAHINVATVAIANKNARIAWAVLNKGQTYQHQGAIE